MKKFKGILVCLALVCLLATCATNQSQDAVSEIDTTEASVSVLVPLEPDAEPAPMIEPEPEPEPVDTVVEDFIFSEFMQVYDGSPKIINGNL